MIHGGWGRLYLHIILSGQLIELHEMAVSLLAKRGSGEGGRGGRGRKYSIQKA
jgi:hypothetical protein